MRCSISGENSGRLTDSEYDSNLLHTGYVMNILPIPPRICFGAFVAFDNSTPVPVVCDGYTDGHGVSSLAAVACLPDVEDDAWRWLHGCNISSNSSERVGAGSTSTGSTLIVRTAW